MDSETNFYVITLKRSSERFTIYKKNCNKDIFNRLKIIYGVDGNTISSDKYLESTSSFGKLIPKAVLGCALSHLLTLKEFISSDKMYALISEDDTLLYYDKFINNYENIKYLSQYGVVFLYHDEPVEINKKSYKDNKIYINNKLIFDNNKSELEYIPVLFSYSFGCYFINKEIAQKIYNWYEKYGIDYHIDTSLSKISSKIKITNFVINGNIAYKTDAKTTMSNNSEKFILNYLSNEGYYIMKIPIIKINTVEINMYLLIIFLLLIITLIIENYYYNNYFIFSIIYFIIGALLWDTIDVFYK